MDLITVLSIVFCTIVLLITLLKEKRLRKIAAAEQKKEKMQIADDIKEFEELSEAINKKFLELNEYYGYINGELEKKYNELIFIYSVVTEKQNKLENDTIPLFKNGEEPGAPKMKITKQTMQSVGKTINGKSQDSEKRKRILDLTNQGFSVDEIAKLLQIGKGEVLLILDLFQ